jgi:ACS family hexuronate transporter-like MFS transporter
MACHTRGKLRRPRAHRKFRWTICGLLFLAATINYVDRQVIGILKPTLQAQFGWTEIDYGDIVFAFQMAYAIGYLFAGRVMDLLGIKRGFALALTIWSLAAMAAAAFPASVRRRRCCSARRPDLLRLGRGLHRRPLRARARRVGQLPRGDQDRGGVVSAAGARLRDRAVQRGHEYRRGDHADDRAVHHGALRLDVGVRPHRRARLRVARRVLVSLRDGRSASAAEGAGARVHHQRSGAAGDAHAVAQPDGLPADVVVRIGEVPDRPDLVDVPLLAARFLQPELRPVAAGARPPIIVIYVVADIGSVGGGWLSSRLIRQGWSVNSARKTAMLICAVSVIPIIAAASVKNMWAAVALISLATAAHQGWSANVFTLASDMFPPQAVGSVVGLGGFAGAVGGMLIAKVTGYVLQMTGSYTIVLMIAGGAYLVALAVVQILTPKLEPARIA